MRDYEAHKAHSEKEKPAVPCSAHHYAIGGGCYNCLYDPEKHNTPKKSK